MGNEPRPRRLRTAFTAVWVVGAVGVCVLLIAAWAGGWRVAVVESASMEPAIPEGSLAITAPADLPALRVGEVIAFPLRADDDVLVLHRITQISLVGGAVVFRTQGDANEAPDPGAISGQRIKGELRWQIPGLGGAAKLLTTPVGAVLLIGTPLLVLIGGEAARKRRLRREATEVVGALEPTDPVAPGSSAGTNDLRPTDPDR